MMGIDNNADHMVATEAGDEAQAPSPPHKFAIADGIVAGKIGTRSRGRVGESKSENSPTTSTGRKGAGRKAPATVPAKQDLVLQKLRSAKGATLEALVEVTGWKPHSVRGFLSGTVKKKFGLPLVSDIGKDGRRRYRIAREAAA